jgi:hypothetical protein
MKGSLICRDPGLTVEDPYTGNTSTIMETVLSRDIVDGEGLTEGVLMDSGSEIHHKVQLAQVKFRFTI